MSPSAHATATTLDTMFKPRIDSAMPGLSPTAVTPLWQANRPHSQPSPGAYEWWRIEAINDQGDGVLLLFFNGMPFHPDYLSRVSRTKRKLKSARAIPPDVQASSYPAAYVAIYQNHHRVAESLNMYPPDTTESVNDGLEIRIGPNRLTMRADGSIGVEARGYPFTMRAGRAVHQRSQELTATLTLIPTFIGVQSERPFRPPARDGATHNWVVAAPHSKIEGSVQLINQKESVALIDQTISGVAYHDHMFGQGVLGRDLQRCVWAHALGNDFAIVWQRTVMAGKAAVHTDTLMLFEKDHEPVIIESPQIVTQKYRRTSPWLMRYPTHVQIHGSDAQGNPAELIVDHALVDCSPFHVRLSARATLHIPGRGRYAGLGSATSVIMGRLKWPLLSDSVIHAILPVPADDPLWRM